MNMNKYHIIRDELIKRVDAGEITLEQAVEINDMAYDKYITESSRLSKEYNKKQTEYRDTVNKADKKIADARYKIEKNKLLQNKDFVGTRRFTDGPQLRTLLRVAEKNDKIIEDAEKDKKRAKYPSKSRGLNRDLILSNEDNSVKTGRRLAKTIAKQNEDDRKRWKKQGASDAFTDEDWDIYKKNRENNNAEIEKGRQAKKKQLVPRETKVGKPGRDHVDDYKPARQRPKNSYLKLQKEIKDFAIDYDTKHNLKSGNPTGGSYRTDVLNFRSSDLETPKRDQRRK